MAGHGVIGSEELRSAEGHFTLFRESKKHKSRTARTRGAVLELRRLRSVNGNQDERSVTSDLQTFTVAVMVVAGERCLVVSVCAGTITLSPEQVKI